MALGGVRRFSVGFSDAFGYWCSIWGGDTPSSQFSFEFYGCPPIVGSLESFLTFAGYCCPCKSGKFRDGVVHSEYPGTKVYFNNCLEEWFDELMVG